MDSINTYDYHHVTIAGWGLNQYNHSYDDGRLNNNGELYFKPIQPHCCTFGN